ncbi:AMP-binding protein [Actinophytocola oryzae]|uniref:AMP-binding enzyme n=1 Tax=Actinophytocola oryzae TaxID=502181 RepID=A0A4R7V4Y2_9PSEU|nr:AMP-binding protein [Actinophytocola oryzae]TDV43717.1 AMP-binding enzyme [Actinophytocola oryzae]
MRLPLSDILACPSLAAALEAAYQRHGDSDALITASESWTYQQLAKKARAVASGLRAAVMAPGQESIVAVVLDRSLEFVATVAGVAATGMPYLPLDPAAPDAYLEQVFAEAQPALVVTSAERAGRLRARTTARVVTYSDLASRDTTTTATATATATAASIVASAGSPAYVIYTSGSTGVPKGVVVPQAALLNSTAARVDQYGAAGRVLLLHSPAFDLTTGVLLWTLLTGGSLIIDPAGLSDVAATVDLDD